MRRCAIAFVVVLSLLQGAASACMWDSDTDSLEEEGRQVSDVVDIIVGRFVRNPPLYYRMRLDRVTKEIESNPDELLLYDDAGVACDRLGMGDDALTWMDRKRERLDALAESGGATPEELATHRYRYLANAGTFWVHRWFRNGADRKKLEEVEKARDLIAAAIELNPDAHFGRERYQLMALEWLLNPEAVLKGYDPILGMFPSFLRSQEGEPLPQTIAMTDGFPNYLEEAGIADASVGVAGLIALGNGWESVDVYNALRWALLAEGHTTISFLAHLRVQELMEAGAESALWDSDEWKSFTNENPILTPQFVMNSWAMIRDSPIKWKGYTVRYSELRAAADDWHDARTSYMVARLQAGEHPDTDPDFWQAFNEPAAPSLGFDQESVGTAKSTGKVKRERNPQTDWAVIFFALGSILASGLFPVAMFQGWRYGWRSLISSKYLKEAREQRRAAKRARSSSNPV